MNGNIYRDIFEECLAFRKSIILFYFAIYIFIDIIVMILDFIRHSTNGCGEAAIRIDSQHDCSM